MTNSSPPPPPESPSSERREERKRRAAALRKNILDEWIGVIVAFGVLGTVLLSSLGIKLNLKNTAAKIGEGLFTTSEDTEKIESPKLSLDRNSGLPAETEAIASLPSEKSSTASNSLAPNNFTRKEAEGDRKINNLLPLGITGVALPKIGELEKPEVFSKPPETEKAEPEKPEVTPKPPVTEKAEPEKSKLAFDDVPKEHWAYPFIQALGEKEFIIANSGNNFEPDKPITRGGMADLVSHAFKNNPENFSAKNFDDVLPNNRRFKDVDKAIKIGFMKGYSDTEFRPELEIPRYQVFVTLATGLGLNPNGKPNSILRKFGDRREMPDWAKAKVAAAIKSGLVINPPGVDFTSLKPNEPATRAEVAAMIHQALVQHDKLDPIESTYIVPYP